jgi:hypothetical protein
MLERVEEREREREEKRGYICMFIAVNIYNDVHASGAFSVCVFNLKRSL